MGIELDYSYNFTYWKIGVGYVSLGRYNKNPRIRVQKFENVNMALEFINSRGVKLTNIGPEGLHRYLSSHSILNDH